VKSGRLTASISARSAAAARITQIEPSITCQLVPIDCCVEGTSVSAVLGPFGREEGTWQDSSARAGYRLPFAAKGPNENERC
jgi:hypothetical protein